MRAALFDVLEGRFGTDGPQLTTVSSSDYTLLSVIANLQRLFNTRKEALPHLPEYGLPDLTTIYRDAPDSFAILKREIRAAVERFEPRVQRVHVEIRDLHGAQMRITFILSGILMDGRRIRLETTFVSQELTQVRSL